MISKIYNKKIYLFVFTFLALFTIGCGVYKFTDSSIPVDIKIVKINIIENRAQYINPQLAPTLTESLRQKIVSQTRLKTTNGDDADWVISPVITSYSMSLGSMANQQESITQLSISIKISVDKKGNANEPGKTETFDVSRNFPFNSNLSLQDAETQMANEIKKSLTDDMFNRIFSGW
ncbi:MAG: hypothetical protein E6Q95_06320 [Chitinophagaceae bacterium]|nr:MAG: hypothetical protein E6Q95_06320 [Chitinophagaceae bacterium]